MESITYVYFGTDPIGGFMDNDTAFFLNIDEGFNRCSCYSFIGQHSLAHIDYIKLCPPMTDLDKKARLKAHLEGHPNYYNLQEISHDDLNNFI